MTSIVTLAERKKRAGASRSAAAARIMDRLSSHAAATGGRFVVFGSAARGEMRHDSDIDILVDFPPALELDAVIFAETACAAEDLPCDVLPFATRTPEFLERIERDAVALP